MGVRSGKCQDFLLGTMCYHNTFIVVLSCLGPCWFSYYFLNLLPSSGFQIPFPTIPNIWFDWLFWSMSAQGLAFLENHVFSSQDIFCVEVEHRSTCPLKTTILSILNLSSSLLLCDHHWPPCTAALGVKGLLLLRSWHSTLPLLFLSPNLSINRFSFHSSPRMWLCLAPWQSLGDLVFEVITLSQ